MACSQVSEALLQRAFHGDFNRMLAWWREQRAQRLAEKAALEAP